MATIQVVTNGDNGPAPNINYFKIDNGAWIDFQYPPGSTLIAYIDAYYLTAYKVSGNTIYINGVLHWQSGGGGGGDGGGTGTEQDTLLMVVVLALAYLILRKL